MSQTVNLLTLRKKCNKNLSFNNHYQTFQLILENLNFVKSFENSLFKKGVIILSKSISLSGNKYFLNLVLFYRTFKQIKYKKKIENFKNKSLKQFKKFDGINFSYDNDNNLKHSIFIIKFLKNSWLKKNKKKNDNKSFVKNISNSILNSLNFNVTNLCYTTFRILKVKEKKYSLLKIYFSKSLSLYSKKLFVRRYNLYEDFLNILCLLVYKKISVESLVLTMGIIFKFLSKRKHSLFFFFFKMTFFSILEVYNKKKFCENNINKVLGLKYKISGRLKGKMRKSSETMQTGSIPVRSIDKNVEYAKSHIYTLYGTFGLKVWLYRDL